MLQSLILILLGLIGLSYTFRPIKQNGRLTSSYIKVKGNHPRIHTFLVSSLIEIASKNLFIVTDYSVYDTVNNINIIPNYIKERKEYMGERNITDFSDDFTDKIIKARAIRAALMNQPRFVQSVLPNYKPDINI